MESFIERLQSENPDDRRWGAEWLADYGSDERAFEPLLKIIRDENELYEIRHWAIHALARTSDPRAFGILLALLEDEAGAWSAQTAVALGRSQDNRAFAPLLQYAHHPDAKIRAMVML